MIPVNSVLQVGSFPEIMQAEINQHLKTVRLTNPHEPVPAGSYEAILTRSSTPIPVSLLEQIPTLKVIACCGVGYDNLPLDYLKAHGIQASTTPGVLNDAVCELGIGLLFALLRRLPAADHFVRSGAWQQQQVFPIATTLAGKTVGIVGLGRIGQDLARRLVAFGVTIAYTGPSDKKLPYTYYSDVNALAKAADIVILTCPGGPETERMINAEVLKSLGPNGFLINIARGSVVDEAALIFALQQNGIAGAALDVFENEPKINPAFLTLHNVILSPHIGSATSETRLAMTRLAIENLDAFFNQHPLLTPIH
jgi:lactate dehydrogenase-like 2-hydroxyacid dehydrogenase